VPSNPSLSYAVIAAFFGAFVFLLLSAILAIGILFYYRDHVLIKKNTPVISLIVLIGVTFSLIGCICLCFGAYDWSCNVNFILIHVFGSLVFSGIIAKNYRIYKIFKNKSATSIVIKDSQLFVIIGAIFIYFFLLFILAICTSYGAYQYSSVDNAFYLYIECSSSSYFWKVFLEILVHVSSTILKLIALALAWLTRKVAPSYSESYEILIILSIYFCVDIVTLPLYFELDNGSNSALIRMILVFETAFITTAATLTILFYSRFYRVYRYDKKYRNGRSDEAL
jgi:hypothetical protein